MASSTNDILYAPCPCGSGKKFKFCCNASQRAVPRSFSSAELPPEVREAEALVSRAQGRIEQEDWPAARKLLEQAVQVAYGLGQGHTNLALVHMMEEHLPEAEARLRVVLENIDSNHTYARALLMEVLVCAGRIEEAAKMVPALRMSMAKDSTHLEKAVGAFAQLREHRELLSYLTRSVVPPTNNVLLHAGIAELNLGNLEGALRYLSRSTGGPGFRTAQHHLRWLRQGRFPPSIGGEYCYPTAFTAVQGGGLPEDFDQRTVAEQTAYISRKPALVEWLISSVEQGDEALQLSTVELLSRTGTPRAIKVLRAIGEGTFGSDNLRLHTLTCLTSAGHLPAGMRHRVYYNGRYTDLQLTGAPPAEHPSDAFPMPVAEGRLYQKSCEASRKGRHQEAESMLLKLLAAMPDHPVILHNLAVTHWVRSGALERAEPLLRKALEVFPAYHYARGSLARMLVSKGRVDDAEALLRPELIAVEGDPTGMAMVLLAVADVHLAHHDVAGALRALAEAQKAAPDSPAVVAMAQALGPMQELQSGLKHMEARVEKRASGVRARALAPDTDVLDAYAAHTVEDLRRILRGLGCVPAQVRGPKDQLFQRLVEFLPQPQRLKPLTLSLSANASRALAHVLRLGGWANEALIARTHDVEEAPEPLAPVNYGPPPDRDPGVLDELTRSGLVVRGTVLGVGAVVVPHSVREPLAQVLKDPMAQAAS